MRLVEKFFPLPSPLETVGRGASATLEVLGRSWTASFGPHELKTFLLPRDDAAPVVETNLLEWS